jgi:hypothetical protein
MPLAHQKGRTSTHSGDFSRQANYVIGLSTRIAVNNKIDGDLGVSRTSLMRQPHCQSWRARSVFCKRGRRNAFSSAMARHHMATLRLRRQG